MCPPIRREEPKKPMFAMWCCPHEFGQPLILIRRPLISSGTPVSVKWSRRCAANPREEETPSLQESVPGQAVMSTVDSAPGSPKPTAFKSR